MKIFLNLGGGGIKGYIEACIMEQIVLKSGKMVHEWADVIAGTSVGSINASLYSLGVHPAQVKAFYETYRHQIFVESLEQELELKFCPKYRAEPFEESLQKAFGDKKMSDALIPLLIVAYDATVRDSAFFKSYDDGSGDILIRDACRASAAAPSYFPGKVIGDHAYYDGGLVSNNPSLCSYVDFFHISRGEELFVIASKCGKHDEVDGQAVENVNGGIFHVLNVLRDSILVAQEGNTDYEMEKFLGDHYLVLDPTEKFRFQMDNVSDKAHEWLMANAESAIQELQPQIDFIVNLIKNK